MILVTGGLGYIGSHTVVELMQSGFEVTVVDDLSNSNIEVLDGISEIVGQKPHFFQIDLKDEKATQRLLEAGPFEGCIHFAASKAVGESQQKPLEYYENNLGSLIQVLKLQITNFIFSSSCTVYGQAETLPIKETTPLKTPQSVYGKTKQMGEQIVEDYVQLLNHKAILLRYFNPIGAHPSALIGELPIGVPNNLVPYITQTVAGLRNELAVFGNDYPTPDGTAIRDYIYVVDLAKAHVEALKNLLEGKQDIGIETYNLGTGRGNSVLEVIQAFEQGTGQSVPFQFAPRREGDIVSAYADSTKANAGLNWEANTSLQAALVTAWEWQKKCM